MTKDNANRFICNEKIQLLREIGPPWTWLHDFSEQHCREGQSSFNFIEEQSIDSCGSTTLVSGDESFDFVTEKPIKIQELEIRPVASQTISMVAKEASCILNAKLTCLKEHLEKHTSIGGIDVSSTDSVISCLEKEEFGVLKGAGEQQIETIDIKNVIDILEESKKTGVKFNNLAELLNYVSVQLPGKRKNEM